MKSINMVVLSVPACVSAILLRQQSFCIWPGFPHLKHDPRSYFDLGHFDALCPSSPQLKHFIPALYTTLYNSTRFLRSRYPRWLYFI
uniref:Putative secreted protein n=1 Tax=Xenopsylla cheopis TaxID=163159 RepID=A0A6M2E273_XENCH